MKTKGFSLIEILIVLAVLAILAGGVWVWWNSIMLTSLRSSPTPILPEATRLLSTAEPTQTAGATPTSNPTTGWESYTNSKYGYSLSYAPNPELKSVTCGKHGLEPYLGDERFILYKVPSQNPEEDYECLTNGENHIITVAPSPYTEVWPCNSSSSWKANQHDVEIAGRGGVQCEMEFTGGERVLPGPDKVIRVSVSDSSRFFVLALENVAYLGTFDHILSTFKFLD